MTASTVETVQRTGHEAGPVAVHRLRFKIFGRTERTLCMRDAIDAFR
jgi:hypothetical protein